MLRSLPASHRPAAFTAASRCPKPVVPRTVTRGVPLDSIAYSVAEAIPEAAIPGLIEGAGIEVGIVAAGAVLAGIAGSVAWSMGQGEGNAKARRSLTPEAAPEAPPTPSRDNAVLVMGASGRIGRRVVQRLIASGRNVVATARTVESVEKTLSELGLKAGFQDDKTKGNLFYEAVDVRDVETLRRPDLWQGVTQVVITLAGKAGMQANGQFGYFPGLSPEDVEAGGVQNLVSVMPDALPKLNTLAFKTVVPMGTAEEVAVWDRMDDVIMGGNSDSIIEAAPDVGPTVARWKGQLIVEGGGFCGARTKVIDGCNLSAYDGVSLRVKGDGSTFKLNIKTVDQLDSPESTYQTTFDTVDGQWHDVMLPWHNFVPVKRAQSDPEGPALDPSKIAKFGLVLSRFEFNKMANPLYKPGPFELLIDGGIKAFKAVRPQIVHMGSAAVERNAIVGDDEEKRKKEIPIVRLNPGGLLNHKYAAETAVRAAGYPYTVVRSVGLVDAEGDGPFKFEADQGDRMSGAMNRDDVADVLIAALNNPEATNKTFEVRRNEAKDGRGTAMTSDDFNRMFLRLAQDRHRWRVGLRPFPKYVPPPAAVVTEQERKEVLQDIDKIRADMAQRGLVEPEAPVAPPPEEDKAEAKQEKELVSANP